MKYKSALEAIHCILDSCEEKTSNNILKKVKEYNNSDKKVKRKVETFYVPSIEEMMKNIINTHNIICE